MDEINVISKLENGEDAGPEKSLGGRAAANVARNMLPHRDTVYGKRSR